MPGFAGTIEKGGNDGYGRGRHAGYSKGLTERRWPDLGKALHHLPRQAWNPLEAERGRNRAAALLSLALDCSLLTLQISLGTDSGLQAGEMISRSRSAICSPDS